MICEILRFAQNDRVNLCHLHLNIGLNLSGVANDIFSLSYYQQADSMTKKDLKSCYQLVDSMTEKHCLVIMSSPFK